MQNAAVFERMAEAVNRPWVLRLGAAPIALHVLFFAGCGSAGVPTPSATLAFLSDRALNGADATNNSAYAYNVWVMNSDGSGARPLTKITTATITQVGILDPAWSPDGRRIAFASARALDGSNGPAVAENIWVMNSDGSGATPLTRITAIDGGDSRDPVWSPDGSKIAFVSGRALDGSNGPAGTANIWVMNSDGSWTTPLTRIIITTIVGGDSRDPTWSPDGSKLAFDSSRALDGTNAVNNHSCPAEPGPTGLCPVANIWVMNADGSDATPLTKLSAFIADSTGPVWSPDGSRLAFWSGRALDGADATNGAFAVGNIWVMNADGSGTTPLTKLVTRGVVVGGQAWSPDGTKLAFESDRALDGTDNIDTYAMTNIWVVNADGSNATPLTHLTIPRADSPVWSPDGSKLAFDSNRALDDTDTITAYGVNIWVMNADGSNATSLTNLTQAACVNPLWNPTTKH